MNRPYYIGYKDEKLGKYLFLGPTESTWYSDCQSARSFSMPELKRVKRSIKRLNKDKKLKILKIPIIEIGKA